MEQNRMDLIKKSRKKPVRSRYQFPSYDLGIAKQIAEKVEFEGAGRLSEETLAITLRVSAKSSGYRLKTLTARQFRLLVKEGEMLSTTPLAKAILKPTSEEERKRKLMESFMAIPLFSAVANRFRGQPLPQSPSFRNILEREFGVESNRASEAERVLNDSAREAGLLYQSGDKTYITTEAIPTMQPPAEVGTPPGAIPFPDKFATTPPGEVTQQAEGLLTVSVRDLGDFTDKDFNEIWNALGKIVRARGKRQNLQEKVTIEEVEEYQEEESTTEEEEKETKSTE